MYPAGELRRLAERRECLRARIAWRREACLDAGARLGAGTRRLLGWGRLLRMGGLAGILGAGWLGRRRRRAGEDDDGGEERRPSRVGRIFQWAPLVLRVARLALGRARYP